MPAVAPHALYTNSDETLKASRALANKYDAPLIIHLSETKKENDDALAKRHMTPDQNAGRAWACSTGGPSPRTACGWTKTTWRS